MLDTYDPSDQKLKVLPMMAKRSRGPKQPPPEPPEKEPVKLSLLVPPDLYSQLEEICNLRGIKTSVLLREMLADNVKVYLRHARGKPPTRVPVLDKDAVAVHLNDELRELLFHAALFSSTSPEAVVQLLLKEHLLSFVTKAKADLNEIVTGVKELKEHIERRKKSHEEDNPRPAE